MPRIKHLTALLFAIAGVSAVFAPRLLDYTFGGLFLTAAAWRLWASLQEPIDEPVPLRWRLPWQVITVGGLALFGGGAIAWGWIPAARVTAGVVCLATLAYAHAIRDSEMKGCAVFVGLFAATGWIGLFPTYMEQELWPGTAAGRTLHGLSGYMLLWLGGLLLVGVAFAIASRRAVGLQSRLRWELALAAIGFVLWLCGALYWCEAFSAGDAQ